MKDIVPDPLLAAVAEECHVPIRCIRSKERWDEYCRPRHIYAYAARYLYGDSFEDIAVVLNRANHSIPQKGYRRVLRQREHFEPELSRVMARFQREAA